MPVRAPSPDRGCSRSGSRGANRGPSRPAGRASIATPSPRVALNQAKDEPATLVSVYSPVRNPAPNPQVQEIRSRVNELVRRYDESLAEDATQSFDVPRHIDYEASSSDSDGDDVDHHGQSSNGRRKRLPAQWKVGDVLLAAHSALARTGAKTERAMVADFAREDPEIAEAMSHGERAFTQALDAAAQRAQQTHEVLARSLAMVQQLQEEAIAAAINSVDSEKSISTASDRQLQQRVRELKYAVDSLNMDKQALVAQLHEQLKAHKEALAITDEQSQALKRAQHMMSLKNEELKAQREETSQAVEAAQQTAANWKEKCQIATKAGSASDGKMQELEAKARALSEELVRVNAVLAAKTQEVDAANEAAKESEAARQRAIAEAQAQADSSSRALAQAENYASNKNAATKRAQAAAIDEATRSLHREIQGLAARLEELEEENRGLAAKVNDATQRKQQFENDNHELARVVREMQERARLQQPQAPPQPKPLPKRSSSFSISLRSVNNLRDSSTREQKRKKCRDRNGSFASRRSSSSSSKDDDGFDDDLSTTSEDEDDDSGRTGKQTTPEAAEIARDEEELNQTMHQVVESAFPRHEPRALLGKRADALDDDIAQFEDPLLGSMVKQGSSATAISETAASATTDEVERVKTSCTQELTRMKTQYVTGLLDYKALVIEQYERRQSEERERHRLEIENLIMLVQAKFKRELERRGQRVMKAQESLKLLYRAMTSKSDGDGADGLSGVTEGDEDDNDEHSEHPGSQGPRGDEEEAAPVPLKSLLRAAILAMSSSTKRNAKASTQITAIYEAVKKRRAAAASIAARLRSQVPAVPTSVVVQSSSPSPPPSLSSASAPEVVVAHASCQVSPSDLVPVRFSGGFRGRAVAPECMDGVVLPSSACFPRSPEPSEPSEPQPPRLLLAASPRELQLEDGDALAARLVVDLRRCLPRLPPGAYFVSAALRRALFRELVRFYAGERAEQELEQQKQEQEKEQVTVGSPRDTPFMRRKALEALARRRTQRRHGAMVLQPDFG